MNLAYPHPARHDDCIAGSPANHSPGPSVADVRYRTDRGGRLSVAAGMGLSPMLAEGASWSAGMYALDGVGGILLLNADGSFDYIAAQRAGVATFRCSVRSGQRVRMIYLQIEVSPARQAQQHDARRLAA